MKIIVIALLHGLKQSHFCTGVCYQIASRLRVIVVNDCEPACDCEVQHCHEILQKGLGLARDLISWAGWLGGLRGLRDARSTPQPERMRCVLSSNGLGIL